MRIRMLTQMPEGATRNGEPWPNEGETADLPTTEAAHLVASGIAERAGDEQPAPSRRPGGRKSRTKEE